MIKTSLLICLDKNNMNGWIMICYLPTGKYKLLTFDAINKFDVNWIQKASKEDYILMFDLDYPKYLSDLHN